MVRALISWSLHNRLIVILGAALLIGVGLHSARNLNVEAYPDPTPPLVEVITQNPGASPEEMERLVGSRERIGPVNLVAADELAKLETEHGSSAAEQAELAEAVNRLRGSIGNLKVDLSHHELMRRGHRGIQQLWELDAPVLVACKGWVMGGSFQRALLCDIRVAAEGARASHRSYGPCSAWTGSVPSNDRSRRPNPPACRCSQSDPLHACTQELNRAAAERQAGAHPRRAAACQPSPSVIAATCVPRRPGGWRS